MTRIDRFRAALVTEVVEPENSTTPTSVALSDGRLAAALYDAAVKSTDPAVAQIIATFNEDVGT